MRKKYIIITGVTIILALFLYYFWQLSEGQLTYRLFNIKEGDYELVSRDNQLSKTKYGGSYTVVLKVNSNQMDTFIDEITEAGITEWPEEERNSIYVISQFEKFMGVEMGEDDYSYWGRSKPRRFILFDSYNTQCACEYRVYFKHCGNGNYEVLLDYCE